jgi:hypothetical protein
LLREHADAVEADLQRFYNLDYRQRWRGNLTLRRLCVLIRFLPEHSAVALIMRDGRAAWGLEAHLLDDVRMTLVGAKAKQHPLRPRPERIHTPERQRKLKDARRRARIRRQSLAEEA